MINTFSEDSQHYFYRSLRIKVEFNYSNGRVICYTGTISNCQSDWLEVTFDANDHLDQLKSGISLVLVIDKTTENTPAYFQTTILAQTKSQPLTLRLSRPEQTNVRSMRGFFRC